MNPASIVFHIIYVRGTVRALLPFLDTLLHWSECRYCLVANGCTATELAQLRHRCQGEARLRLTTQATTLLIDVHRTVENRSSFQEPEP